MKRKLLFSILSAIIITMCLSVDTVYCAQKKTRTKKNGTTQSQSYLKADSHNYYRGLTKQQANEADKVAHDIAQAIMAEKKFASDLKRVKVATRIVARFCSQSQYMMDEQKYYRSPYGVFVAGVFTCAGATRALGRVLDFMGYNWQHVNENQNAHQWCILNMDGQQGFADGQVGVAGYGEHF